MCDGYLAELGRRDNYPIYTEEAQRKISKQVLILGKRRYPNTEYICVHMFCEQPLGRHTKKRTNTKDLARHFVIVLDKEERDNVQVLNLNSRVGRRQCLRLFIKSKCWKHKIAI